MSRTSRPRAAATPARRLLREHTPRLAARETNDATVQLELPQRRARMTQLEPDDAGHDSVERTRDDEHHAVVRRQRPV